jgi:tetratricopeptide (TPR) repeat protein
MAEAVHVGEGGRKSKAPRWQFVVALIAVLLVAAGAGAGVRWVQSRGDNIKITPKAPQLPENVQKVQDLSLTGQYDEANKYIDQELAKPGLSAQDKYNLLYGQGTVAANQGNYQAALESYKKAEAAQPTASLSQSIAEAAEKLGDTQLAITYYKKTITQLDTDSPLYGEEKASLEHIIKNLGGKP